MGESMLPSWLMGRYAHNVIADDPLFKDSAPGRELAARPLGFIDVGARGGVHDLLSPVASMTAVLGFEPDLEACAELNSRLSGRSAWAAARFLPVAVADRAGPATLYLCQAPTNHSLRPINSAFVERYRMVKFSQTGRFELQTQTLDHVVFSAPPDDYRWGEFVKLDTQGTEFEILQGAERMLDERCVAAFVEVEFCQIYEGQKLFSELEVFFRERGFSFFGFHSTHERARKVLDKRRFAGRERLLHADAVFFKDPLPGGPSTRPLSARETHILFTCALLLGYFDYALELAEATFASNPDDRASILALIEKLAFNDPAQARAAAMQLALAVEKSPGSANVEVGRFVDERRAMCNFEDVLAAT
jgi:FkbM family methyltransferase